MGEPLDLGPRRSWVPDIKALAQQLIDNYRSETSAVEGLGEPGDVYGQGDLDALATLDSWAQTASDHGEEITEDDLHTLIQRLARIAAGRMPPTQGGS